MENQMNMKHPFDRFLFCPVCGSREFAANSPKSKRCGACGFELFMNASAANVALITNERGELLVTRRKKDPARGTLDLPGGFADPDETAEEGVMREVMEETGMSVVRVQYLFSLPNRYLYSGLSIPTLDMFFRCEVADTSNIKAMDDVAECLWMPLEDINPADFGLRSISEGVARFIAMKGENT
jgi:mutator protein MutT